jgi:hypothetical protein
VPLGAEADRGVQDEGRQDRDRIGPLAEEGGNDRRQEQKEDHEAPELIDPEPPERCFRLVGDAVRSDSEESAARLLSGEPLLRIGTEARRNLRGREGVPGMTSDVVT